MNWSAAKPCTYDPNFKVTDCCCQSGDGCNKAVDMVNGVGYIFPLTNISMDSAANTSAPT